MCVPCGPAPLAAKPGGGGEKEGGVEIEIDHQADAFLSPDSCVVRGKCPGPAPHSEAPTWMAWYRYLYSVRMAWYRYKGDGLEAANPRDAATLDRRSSSRLAWIIYFQHFNLPYEVARQELPRHASSPVRSFNILWRRRHRQTPPYPTGAPLSHLKNQIRVSHGGVGGRPRGLEATPRGCPPSAYKLSKYRSGGLHRGCKYQLQPAF